MEVDFAALKAGNERAWDAAFARLYPLAHHAARTSSAGLTDSEAEDVAIEALEHLVTRVTSLAAWNDLVALAITIAARRAISKKRHDTAEKRGAGRVDSIEALQEESEGVWEAAESGTPSLSAGDLRELQLLLQPALAELEPVARRVVLGFLEERKSYRELAEELNLPMGTVGVTLSRSLRKLRTALEKSPRLMKEIEAFWR
jgi:RNA polymerase sigma factor (sigma-70 family)